MATPPPQGLPYPQTQPKPVAKGQQAENVDLTAEVSSISRRLRILEERYSNLNKKTQVSEQNVLAVNKDLNHSIRAVGDGIVELKRELEDFRDKLKLVVLELKECAKQDEVMVLKKYIDLWELVNFPTRQEVERIMDEKLTERRNI